MRRERLIAVMRIAWVALAIVALAQRAPLAEARHDREASVQKQPVAQPISVAVPQLEVKRTLGASPAWALAQTPLLTVAAPQARLVAKSRQHVVDSRERARLRAHPAHGPPALS